MDPILYWNAVALEANKVDFSREKPEGPEQAGPTLSSRALAIVHLAMYDAYAKTSGEGLAPYLTPATLPPPPPPFPPPPPPSANTAAAAVAAAAHATLSKLFLKQKPFFDQKHTEAGLTGTVAEVQGGHQFGLAVAQALLKKRKDDPGGGDDGYAYSMARYAHRPDPDNSDQGFHAPFYGASFGTNYFLATVQQTLDSPQSFLAGEYIAALQQVHEKGIAPELTATLPAGSSPRTPEETLIGIFWGYDGAKNLGTPPRLYNQIVQKVAEARSNTIAQNACLFALINGAMADAGVMAWQQKYVHDFWRPVVGIREHDESMGPAANVDVGAIHANCDPFWLPLGAPNSNRDGKNFTPPFPAYPSGHATFGAAALHMTRLFYGVATSDHGPDILGKDLKNDPTGDTDLIFVSDELNGRNKDIKGSVRPRHVRSFPGGLWEMIVENGRSRVFLGVHWVFDAFALQQDSDEPDLLRNIGGVILGLKIAEEISLHSPVFSLTQHPKAAKALAAQTTTAKKGRKA